MKVNCRYCILFLFPAAFIGAPLSAAAEIFLQKDGPPFATTANIPGAVITVEVPGQDEKQDTKKKGDQKPDVKEVPKSRRQAKPAAVKTKVRIKTPVKKIKPVIKKPLKLVHTNLGI
jgi:hypothetical protein